MTPEEIEILMHCHVHQPRPTMVTPEEAVTMIVVEENGLVELHPGGYYKTTYKVKVHIEQLCKLECPTQQWISKGGEVIEI